MIDNLNAFFWILSNILVGYIAVALVVFAIAYPILFDPRATTAGKFILRFIGSLIGIIGLVFIAIFIDPRDGGAWFQFPGDILWWRPAIRFAAYCYVAYTLTGLVVILWLRKFRPRKLTTAPNENGIPHENTIPIKVRRPRS